MAHAETQQLNAFLHDTKTRSLIYDWLITRRTQYLLELFVQLIKSECAHPSKLPTEKKKRQRPPLTMLSLTKRIKFSNSNTQTSQFIQTKEQKINPALFCLFLNEERLAVRHRSPFLISDSVFKNNDLIRNVFTGWLIEDTNDVVSCVVVFVWILRLAAFILQP